jgi:hypothetical protein
VQIGFEYAKLVVIEFARLHQVRASARFDAVIDIFSSAHSEPNKHYNPSTLPSSQTFVMPHPPQQPVPLPRLNTYQSMPNFHPNTVSVMSYQPPHSIPFVPAMARPESSPYLQPHLERSELPAIPRLE